MFDDQRVHRNDSKDKRQKSGGPLRDSKEEGARALSGTHDQGRRASSRDSEENRLSSSSASKPKVALVHDWLNGMRGGEIVFEAMIDLYPDADVFTLVYEPENLSERLRDKLSRMKVQTSWMNATRFTKKNYRKLLPILPFAIRSLDLYPYDLILSSSHCVAKGVKKHSSAFHLSYLHAPMRYMWDRFDDYFGKGRIHPLYRVVAKLVRPFLQGWDKRTSTVARIDVMLANSRFIAEQILRCYQRKAQVVYPFAKLERFKHARKPGTFYLMVGAFAPYKRTDLAIEAFARLGLPLKIVGQGQDEAVLLNLKKHLGAENIEFIRSPSNEVIEALYSQCKAFVFPGKEDFGITPLEAMASGAPIIAYNEGGACETVTDETGILFSPQTVDALCDAVMDIESGRKRFDENACRARAGFFTEARFKQEILASIENAR
jgi:glycosyltransferase involved in cell wall biosynthesis